MNLKLSVDVREVDEQERVRTGVSDESLKDPVYNNHQSLVVQSFLQLLGLPPGLRQLGGGGGEGGEEAEQEPDLVHS